MSKYFTWAEVTRSDTTSRNGIDNSVPQSMIPNVKFAASKMDYVRIILDCAVLVNSWYRNFTLNRLLKSKDTSDHPLGLAVDFISPDFGTPLEICKYLLQYEKSLQWKQLILEHDWVHISFYSSVEAYKGSEILTLLANGTYARGLTDKYGIPV